MANQQPRRVSPEDLHVMARVAGVEIAPDRLERLADQVTAIFQTLDQLDPAELHSIEPATAFRHR